MSARSNQDDLAGCIKQSDADLQRVEIRSSLAPVRPTLQFRLATVQCRKKAVSGGIQRRDDPQQSTGALRGSRSPPRMYIFRVGSVP